MSWFLWLEYFADAENPDFFTRQLKTARTWSFQPSASTRDSSGYASSVAKAGLYGRSPSCSRELRLT